MAIINTLNHVTDILYLDTFYDDLRLSGNWRKKGSNEPAEVTYNEARLFAFDNGEELGFTTQMPHGWKIGTNLDFHIHWTPGTRGVTESGKTVYWKAEFQVVGIGSNFGSPTIYTLHDTCDGVDDKHQLVDATASVDMSAITSLSAVIIGRIYRDAGDNWVGVGNNCPILLEADFHYQMDTPGSREEYVK